jgi:prepilin-type N-terminal cleavage/methylation domain-containing protein
MKTQSPTPRRGFTLMELMVAMAITTIIVTVLVSITSIALDTWNRSRSELRAARQAKSMIDTMARDFESLVTRSGNSNQWLSAVLDPDLEDIGNGLISENASRLIFFTAATDRYGGNIGVSGVDNGGDVSCVAYQLGYRDPIGVSGAEFRTYVMNRLLVNPDETFQNLLGTQNLDQAFAAYEAALPSSSKLTDSSNFVCENVFQFTVTFHVQVTDASGVVSNIPVTVGTSDAAEKAKTFKFFGSGIETSSTNAAQLRAGKLVAMEVSVSVLTDYAVDQLRTRTISSTERASFLAKNSYQYSKLVQLPSM